MHGQTVCSCFFFFNDTATTEIYTLSLHDALPISWHGQRPAQRPWFWRFCCCLDRKSTRLNSSHSQISYAVFCLKKKNRRRRRCVPLLLSERRIPSIAQRR